MVSLRLDPTVPTGGQYGGLFMLFIPGLQRRQVASLEKVGWWLMEPLTLLLLTLQLLLPLGSTPGRKM
jgi:hypothetical protein